MRHEAELWWNQAEKDFANAEKVFDLDEYYLVAFLVHQAVEKALKACYVELEGELPDRTHSLVLLGKEVGLPEALLSTVRRINPDYISTRYPDVDGVSPYEAYDESLASERLEPRRCWSGRGRRCRNV